MKLILPEPFQGIRSAENAYRDIDIENALPACPVDQEPAQDGTDHGADADHGTDAEAPANDARGVWIWGREPVAVFRRLGRLGQLGIAQLRNAPWD